MSGFMHGFGPWPEYRKLPGVREIDLHWSGRPGDRARKGLAYWEAMDGVRTFVLEQLQSAFEDRDVLHLLITHGASTSRPGKTTARSVVRGIMRSKEATPYIHRARCIQHETVFVAALRR